MNAATLTGFAAGIGWIAKNVLKENFAADPSANVMNYAKFTAVMAGSVALKQYLEDQKIVPTNSKNKHIAICISSSKKKHDDKYCDDDRRRDS